MKCAHLRAKGGRPMTDAPCMLAIPGYEPVDVHFTANGWRVQPTKPRQY